MERRVSHWTCGLLCSIFWMCSSCILHSALGLNGQLALWSCPVPQLLWLSFMQSCSSWVLTAQNMARWYSGPLHQRPWNSDSSRTDFFPFYHKNTDLHRYHILVFAFLPRLTKHFFEKYGDMPAEVETKYILRYYLGMAALATWAGSEAVLPAYIIGMVLAGILKKSMHLFGALRTLTLGFLTPFYFICEALSCPFKHSSPPLCIHPIAYRKNSHKNRWSHTLLPRC